MNILEIQEALKGMSEDQLVKEMQQPSGNAPSYLVLTELERRKDMKKRFDAQQPKQPTVAEEALMGGLGGMMPQQAPQQMMQQAPQQMMQQPPQQMMPQEPMRMNIGGIARLLGQATRGTQRIPKRGVKTQIQPQSGGTNMPMAPIDPRMLPVPYTGPASSGGGLSSLGGIGRTLLGATPIGAGAYAMMPGSVGDGTMAGRFGLSEEEYEMLVAEAEKRGITPYDERFADLVASFKQPQQPASQEAAVAQAQQAQQAQQEGQTPDSFLSQYLQLMQDQRKAGQEMRDKSKYLALAQAGQALTASDRPLLQAASQAAGAGLKGLMSGEQAFRQSEADYMKSLGTLATAEMKSKGKSVSVGNLVDLVETLQKDIMLLPEEEQEARRQQIREIQQLIREKIGLQGAPTGGIAGVSQQAIDAELRARGLL